MNELNLGVWCTISGVFAVVWYVAWPSAGHSPGPGRWFGTDVLAGSRERQIRLSGRDYSSGIPSGGALLAATVRCGDEVKDLARVEAGRAPLAVGVGLVEYVL